ncbi:uncharacterized protein LOC124866918 [Girardinichthys multiradiatus]|uniref:uncharacterized protein LOC124866918 n=1 Tax=Girardinichthys multiradiatus TaxID=208333 RepID=UPI001FACC4DB|nr:uncharacterized protein LOC124866918 [Girardinichthys multiradiatus]
MHRGARKNKPETQLTEEPCAGEEEMEAGASTMAADTGGEDDKEPTLRDLTGILQAFMGQQEAREVKLNQECEIQGQRFKALKHQFQLLQMEVQARTSPLPEPSSTNPETREDDYEVVQRAQVISAPVNISSGQSQFSLEPKLQKLTSEDDIEHFLVTFERIAAACRWPKADWVFRLIPLLTGKARSAYVHMDVDETLNYDNVKTAILKKYDINPETYRQRFCSLYVYPDESPKELYVRLKELFGKWILPRGVDKRA